MDSLLDIKQDIWNRLDRPNNYTLYGYQDENYLWIEWDKYCKDINVPKMYGVYIRDAILRTETRD